MGIASVLKAGKAGHFLYTIITELPNCKLAGKDQKIMTQFIFISIFIGLLSDRKKAHHL
jgi:hypothetical protein